MSQVEVTSETGVQQSSPNLETVARIDGANTIVSLQVSERAPDGNSSRRSSVSSSHSNRSNNARLPSKWFFRRGSRRNTTSTTRTRTTTRTSGTSNQASDNENTQARIHRKKSVMHGIMKRGRTMRKTMKAMQINEADPGGSEREGARGYALTSEQKLRIYVLKEILETEEDYTKLLQFIIDVIIPNLQRLAKDDQIPCVTHTTVSEMLSNIREIHKLHVRFASALKDVMSPYPYHSNCIGNIFLEYKDEFKVYGQFCANFKNAQKISYQLQEDPVVLQLIQEWKDSVASKTRKFLHLEGFIISPVQRLCKYPLLLRELKKFTSESHSDYKPVINAMEMMEEVTASVNESERRAITMQIIRDVDNLFDSWEKSGVLSKQGFMTKQGGSVKTWNIRWFTLSGYEMKYYHEPTDQRPLGTLDLTSYKSLDADASHAGRPHAFGIKMPDRTYYMYTISEKEKEEWLTILNWKIACIDRSRKQAHRPFETMIFSSLSSFLHPKERIDPPTSHRLEPTSPNNGTTTKQSQSVSKGRSKSLFKSFRSKRKQRASMSVSSNWQS